MRGAIFLGLPVILAVALLLVPARSKTFWLWWLAACAITHTVILAYGKVQFDGHFDVGDYVKWAIFMVCVPWFVVAMRVVYSPYPRERFSVAISVPLIWAGSSFVSYQLGLILGILYI
jgi:hypothetical protein